MLPERSGGCVPIPYNYERDRMKCCSIEYIAIQSSHPGLLPMEGTVGGLPLLKVLKNMTNMFFSIT
jgi:hypothetical protein